MPRIITAVILAFLVAGCASWSGDPGTGTASGSDASTSVPPASNVSGSTSAPNNASSTSTSTTSSAATNSTTSSSTTSSSTTNATSGPPSNATLNSTHIGFRALAGARSPSCAVVRIGTNCHLVFLKVWSNVTKDVDVAAGRWIATTASNRQQEATSSDTAVVLAGHNATILLKWSVTDDENGDRIESIRYSSPRYNATIVVPSYPTARMPVTDGGGAVTALRLGCHAAHYSCPMPSNHVTDLIIAGVAGDPLDPGAPQHAFNGTLQITVTKGVYNITSTEPYEELYAVETPIFPESTTGTNPLQSLFSLPAVTIEAGYEYRIHVRATFAANDNVVQATHSWHY